MSVSDAINLLYSTPMRHFFNKYYATGPLCSHNAQESCVSHKCYLRKRDRHPKSMQPFMIRFYSPPLKGQ